MTSIAAAIALFLLGWGIGALLAGRQRQAEQAVLLAAALAVFGAHALYSTIRDLPALEQPAADRLGFSLRHAPR